MVAFEQRSAESEAPGHMGIRGRFSWQRKGHAEAPRQVSGAAGGREAGARERGGEGREEVREGVEGLVGGPDYGGLGGPSYGL